MGPDQGELNNSTKRDCRPDSYSTKITAMRCESAGQIAQLHLRCFGRDYPLTPNERLLMNLGEEYFRLFFDEFCRHDFNMGIEAAAGAAGRERIQDYVAATLSSDEHYRHFYKKYYYRLCLLVLRRAMISQSVRHELLRKAGSFYRASMAAAGLGKSKTTFCTSQYKPSAQLMYIGVDTAARGQGIASVLLNRLCSNLSNKGIERVECDINEGNIASIRLFEKNGWHNTKGTVGEAGHFIKDLL